MTIRVTTDAAEIVPLLERTVAADPVRGTVLGTIELVLRTSGADGWCAASEDGRSLAVRSDREHPVALAGLWPAQLHGELVAALAELTDVVGLIGPVHPVEDVGRYLPAPVQRTALRLFRLDTLAAPEGVAGRPRRATHEDRALVLAWYRAFADEAHGLIVGLEAVVDAALDSGGCWLWLDGSGLPASLATRRPVIAGSSRIGPVYTPVHRRGRGYGSAVTAAATQDVLSDGAVPVLFTDLSNPTSNDIYRQLGYTAVEDRLELRLR